MIQVNIFQKSCDEIMEDNQGCYEKPITYIDADSEVELPLSQIVSLIELSETCVQSFQYDCTLGMLSKSNL